MHISLSGGYIYIFKCLTAVLATVTRETLALVRITRIFASSIDTWVRFTMIYIFSIKITY